MHFSHFVADKEGLVEICIQFNSPRKKRWRFLGTVKIEKIIASQLSSPYPEGP